MVTTVCELFGGHCERATNKHWGTALRFGICFIAHPGFRFAARPAMNGGNRAAEEAAGRHCDGGKGAGTGAGGIYGEGVEILGAITVPNKHERQPFPAAFR